MGECGRPRGLGPSTPPPSRLGLMASLGRMPPGLCKGRKRCHCECCGSVGARVPFQRPGLPSEGAELLSVGAGLPLERAMLQMEKGRLPVEGVRLPMQRVVLQVVREK